LFVRSLPELAVDLNDWVREKLTEKSEVAAAQLRAAGYSVTYSVVESDADDAIRNAMREQTADLLILGAQGHGFFERMLTGSVALHHTVSEPYSVLLVRA
jgi:nucleotide-binding universal stress UspA family protein